MELKNENFPIDATYEELLELFGPVNLERMDRFLQITLEKEEYLYAKKVKRVIAFKKSKG